MSESGMETSGKDRRESPAGPVELPRAVMSRVPGTCYSSTLPPERRLLRVSPGWDELLRGGESTADDPGRSLSDLVHPDDRSRVETDIERSLEASGSFSVFYRVALGGDGPNLVTAERSRWVWDRGRAVDEGEEHRVDGLLLDITELKFLEDRAVQAQRKEALGTLAGSVAQEFNDLLTAIYGSLELARVQADDPRIVKDEIQVAAQAVKRARFLTGQLLSFTRARPQRPGREDPNELVERIEPLIDNVAGNSIRTVLALDSDVSKAYFDPGLMEQAVMNLVLNAREAMEEEGGRLLVSTGNVLFDDDDLRRGDEVRPGRYATISVSDSGPGVDRGVRHRIYEPFFSTKEGHSGLGLSAAFGIVRQSGGILRLRSNPGRGTRATIYLPAAEEAAGPGELVEHSESDAEEASVRPPGTESRRGSGERVLVVEDDDAIRDLLVRIVIRSGYEAVAVDRAEDALELVAGADSPYDLLLTDVMLPGMKGPELARTLRELQPEVRILIISGFPDDPELRESGLPGGAVFLAKPFTIEELLGAMEEALSRPLPLRPGSATGEGATEAG